MDKRRKTLLAICVALVLCFIWGNSLLPATASKALSQAVKDWLDLAWHQVEGDGGETAHAHLRKVAHCMEYALLGAVVCRILAGNWREKWKTFLLCGMTVAWIDETLQLFSPGRSAQIDDLWIDMTGFVLGGLMVLVLTWLVDKKRKQ